MPVPAPLDFDCRPAADRRRTALAAFARGVRAWAGLPAVLALAVALLWPMLRSGFYYDDIKNSCVAGFLQLSDASLFMLIQNCTVSSMLAGRFFPGALAITFAVHYWFTTPAAYKTFLLVLTLANLVQFYYLLRSLQVPKSASQLFTLALVLLFQMRAFGDALLAFAGIMQVVTSQLLLSLIFLRWYGLTSRRRWLAASLAVYTTSLVTYEISYCFLPAYLALALADGRDWRRAARVVQPYVLVAGVLAAYVFGLRYGAPLDRDNTYCFSLDPATVAGTALAQASAALPVTYALLSPHRPLYFNFDRALGRWDNWLLALAAGTLTGTLLWQLRREAAGQPLPALGLLCAMGAAVWILPGLPIAVSSKYQDCVKVGLGYLPVYVQYCGVAMLVPAVLLAAARVCPLLRRPLAAAAVLGSTCIVLITADTNRHLVDVRPSTANNRGQQIVEAALAAGLADEVPAGAHLVTTGVDSIELLRGGHPLSSSFVTQLLQRKVNALCVAPGPGLAALQAQLVGQPTRPFVLSVHCQDGQSGCILLGRLESDLQQPSPAFSQAQSFRLFVASTPATGPADAAPAAATRSSAEDAAPATSGWALHAAATGHDPPEEIDRSKLKLLERGPAGALYAGSFRRPVDLDTVELRPAGTVGLTPARQPAEAAVSIAESRVGYQD